jgi:hypothetical protein
MFYSLTELFSFLMSYFVSFETLLTSIFNQLYILLCILNGPGEYPIWGIIPYIFPELGPKYPLLLYPCDGSARQVDKEMR